MIKGQAAGEQFLTRSGSFATRGSRNGLDLLGLGAGQVEAMTPEQEREALKAARFALEAEIKRAKLMLSEKLPYKEAESLKTLVAENGLRIRELSDRAAELNRLRKVSKEDIGAYIIDTVRRKMTKPQWLAIVKEAQARFDADEILYSLTDGVVPVE